VTFDSIADTSVMVRLLRRDSQMESNVRGHKFAITFVTLAELDLGFLKARNPLLALRTGMEVLRDVKVLNGSGKTPSLYAEIYFDLEQRGKMIPVNDIWIAALALETGLPLLARDEHFSRVRDLSVIEC
jgi:tRNA(fMet)-specific endonuclease VapC